MFILKNDLVKISKNCISVFCVFALMVTAFSSAVLNNVSAEENVGDIENVSSLNVSDFAYREYIDEQQDAEKLSSKDLATVVEDNEEGISISKNTEKDFVFNVSKTGLYTLQMDYTTLDNGSQSIELSLSLDGSQLFDEFSAIELKRYFKDVDEERVDSLGNESAKSLEQEVGRYSFILKSDTADEKLFIKLNEGEHTLKLFDATGDFLVNSLKFVGDDESLSYKEYINNYSGEKKYSEFKLIEAEDTLLKSSSNMAQMIDSTSPKVHPNSPTHDVVNYVGGGNWSMPGDKIVWKISVPESGLYQIGMNYRQNYNTNVSFYRELEIDGVCPFGEAEKIEFPYAMDWTFMTLGDSAGKPYYFYLEKGEHTLSLEVTLGNLSKPCTDLADISAGLAELYRSIIMITGDTPDVNRDYNLFDRIENLGDKLKEYCEQLENVNKDFEIAFRSNAVSPITTVNSMINAMEQMMNHKFRAHEYVSRYYDCYSSLTSMMMELNEMPLDIDRIYYGNDFEDTDTGFFTKAIFSVRRFLDSFADDYVTETGKDREKITIWLNWGRDQAKVLKTLIQNDFSIKNNIDVDIKITNATLTHAALSGNGPDCQLHLSRSEPVNLAMRDAVYDLSKFEDFDEVKKRFMPKALNCYSFEDGFYALPDTQTFYMLFIRTDIFEDLGLEVPKTWKEFRELSVLLMKKNMQVGLPYTQITEMTQVNTGVGALSIFPTFLIQSGGKLYNDGRSEIQLLSDVSVDAFTEWTDYYTKYGFSRTYDFFNRFRLGLMPMAIQSYTLYSTITSAAPEISGKWEMFEIPGTVQENGEISNITTGGGTGAVILSKSKHKEAAWEFIKWWTSEDIQYRYGNEIENILGPAARNPSATVAAVEKYEWKASTLNNIVSQWNKVEELPEVPGGYYVSRVIDQAFWNVTSASENPKDMLMKWADIAQTEITRKREQYNIQ